MKFTEQDVRDVADLANLRLSEEEVHRMAGELGAIVTYVEQLSQLDTANVEPMAQVVFEQGETATLRDDVERRTILNADALANAPISGAGYFKVPKVIER